MDKEQQKTQKITAGKKNNNIILNPPEKPPIKNVNERFKDVLPKHSVVIEKKIELVLQAKANAAEFPEEALRQVFVRGFRSLPLNSQLTREQHAMNRVNSFIAGGQAMQEDCDLLPIEEKFKRLGMKGTGGARRPHIKREKSPYNNKTVFHVVDAKGVVKHSTSDEGEAKQHLASKYNSYLGEEGKGLWANIHAKRERIKHGSGEHMRKPGSKGAPTSADLKRSAVKEDVEPVNEISKELANRYYYASKSAGDAIDTQVSDKVKKLRDKWTQRTHNKVTDLIAKSQKRTTGRLRAIDRLAKEETEVKEATSVAVRMQRALDKIKAERERKERLAAPFVNSVFGKKDEKQEPKKD